MLNSCSPIQRMETRTRHSVLPETQEEITFRCVLGSSAEHPDRKLTYTIPSEDEMYEEITPNSDGPQSQWKSFEHYKRVRDVKSGDSMGLWVPTKQWGLKPHYYAGTSMNPSAGYTKYTQYTRWQEFGDAGKLNSGLPDYYVKRADGGFVPPPADLNNLKAHSMRVMLPIIKEELSLINSIYELKDFKHMARTLSNVKFWQDKFNLITKNKAMIALLARKNKALTLGFLLRQASNNYLQWSFAIAPLISDIRSIYTALKRTERRLNDFITRSGRVQSKHFRFVWTETPDLFEVDEPNMGGFHWFYQLDPYVLFRSNRTVRNEPTIFHAQVQYNYNYTEYQIAHARLLGMLDSLGVNLNPAIIWNAIPWTFIVDWVFGVSRWLEQFKEQNMAPLINIRRYLWSVKRSRRIFVMNGIDPIYASEGFPTYNRTSLPTVMESSYRRHVGMPEASLIESSGLNLKEFSLGAALVIARRRRSTTFPKWRRIKS